MMRGTCNCITGRIDIVINIKNYQKCLKNKNGFFNVKLRNRPIFVSTEILQDPVSAIGYKPRMFGPKIFCYGGSRLTRETLALAPS